MEKCIGLFGTCGKSTWRKDLFIPAYLKLGMKDGEDFFNPQVEGWDESMAKIEANHLATDGVILFPVTGETYGTGSLTEVGFSILNAIKLDDRRDFVIYIEESLDDNLKEGDPTVYKESMRARRLVLEHLKKIRFGNVFVIPSSTERDKALQIMLEISTVLYKNMERTDTYLRKYSSLFQDPTR